MRLSITIMAIATLGIFFIAAIYLIENSVPIAKHQNESIIITAYDDSIPMHYGGTSVLAQLYFNGSPYKKKGVKVTFESDNHTVATLSNNNYGYTDDNGTVAASISSNRIPGTVKITASYDSNGSKVSNYTYINIYRPGSICGLVRDRNGNGIPDALVTLWHYTYNSSSKKFENTDVSKVLDSSTHNTGIGRSTPAGSYEYVDIPAGTYNITVEKDGHTAYSLVDVDYGTKTCMIDMPDYEYTGTPNFVLISPPISNGTIWGMVDLFTGNISLRDVNVILWYTKYNPTNDTWENLGVVDVPNNPQVLHANIGFNNTPGRYKFDNVPAGTYKITASDHAASNQEYNASEYITSDHRYYTIVKLNDSTSINFIVLMTPLYS